MCVYFRGHDIEMTIKNKSEPPKHVTFLTKSHPAW